MTTAVDEAFRWMAGPTGRILQSEPLLRVADHLFTTRDASFRGPAAATDEARLAAALGLEGEAVVTVRQVHERAVLVVQPGVAVPPTEADAIVSTDAARAIAVRVADCVPVLLADSHRRVVAAVHAGWRGTRAGVAGAAVAAIAALGVPASDLFAALGPSIGPCCYDVGEHVRQAFLASGKDAARWFADAGQGRWRLDLWQANVDQLQAAGVPSDAIRVARLCTKDHPETCYSYRRDGPGAGRMVAAIRLRRDPVER